MRLRFSPRPALLRLAAFAAAPVMVIFLSSNIVNAGNLLFNLLFSRWMGPELFGELATLLTLKLALLGCLGALTFAVSKRVAEDREGQGGAFDVALSQASRSVFVAVWIVLPLLVGAVLAGDVGAHFGLRSSATVAVLVLSLPFLVPLSLLRGVAIGRMDARAVVLSANAEMIVRLLVATLAWELGFGLTGVVASIALSIVAGWLPLRSLLPRRGMLAEHPRSVDLGPVLRMAAPFAVLQASQVVLLDGDTVLAAIFLTDTEVGYVAALSLFQRIQFFACFGLASVLLPSVAGALASGRSPLPALLPVLALFAVVSSMILVAAAMSPDWMVRLLAGAEFAPAAPFLGRAAPASVAFTLSYLLATYLSAQGDRVGIGLIALACPVQLLVMFAAADDLGAMLAGKLAVQIGLAVLVVSRCVSGHISRQTPSLSRSVLKEQHS